MNSGMAVLFSNSSNEVGGGNNGCDDFLGKECENLKEVSKTVRYYTLLRLSW